MGNKLDKTQSLLAELLSKCDQWRRHVYSAGGDHEALRDILEGMLASLVKSRLHNLCASIPDGLEERLLPCLQRALEYKLVQAEGDIDELEWESQLWGEIALSLTVMNF